MASILLLIWVVVASNLVSAIPFLELIVNTEPLDIETTTTEDPCAELDKATSDFFFSQLLNITQPGDLETSLSEILATFSVGISTVGVYEGIIENGTVTFNQCTVIDSTIENLDDLNEQLEIATNGTITDDEAIFVTRTSNTGSTIELFANTQQSSTYPFKLVLIHNDFNGSLPYDPCAELEKLKLEVVLNAYALQVDEADNALFIVNLPVYNGTIKYDTLLEECAAQREVITSMEAAMQAIDSIAELLAGAISINLGTNIREGIDSPPKVTGKVLLNLSARGQSVVVNGRIIRYKKI